MSDSFYSVPRHYIYIINHRISSKIGIFGGALLKMTDWTVYILRCSDNSLYTGITRDLNRRLDEHNKNDHLASTYTRARRPVKLVYHEAHSNRSSASKREAMIKKMSRKAKEKMIVL